jgi:hypothetical protein
MKLLSSNSPLAVSWLRRLVAGLSPRRPGFDPGVRPCGICGGQSGTGTGFPPSTSVFPCQFYSNGAPLHGKTKKLILLSTAEARLRSRVRPCEICGGQRGTGTGFSPSTSVFPCQFRSTGAPLHEKTKKLIFFIIWLHNKPQGCGAYVASAAEPFTTKRNSVTSSDGTVGPEELF